MKKDKPKSCLITKVMIRWFWTRCHLCDCQFKKEPMWKFRFPKHFITRHICERCAPDYLRAEYLSHAWGEDGNLKPSFMHTQIRHPRLKEDN